MQSGDDFSAEEEKTHQYASPAEASHPRRESDVHALANSSRNVLFPHGSMACPRVVFDVSKQASLGNVDSLKDVVTVGDMDTPLLSGLHAATSERNRRPQTTDERVLPLVEVNPEKVTLSVKDTAEIDVHSIHALELPTSLIIHETGDLNKLEMLKEIKNLTELKFVGFGVSTFPLWVKVLPCLVSLSFEGDMLSASAVSSQEIAIFGLLPSSVSCLELSCTVHPDIMKNFSRHATRLTELALKMPVISKGLNIGEFNNLRALKLISLTELDDEVFSDVAALKDLESLLFCGCPNLTVASLSLLTGLANLKELCIQDCVFGDGVCEKIMSMQSLTTVKFFSCWGVSLFPLCQNPNLNVVWVIDCMGARVQLPEFLTCLGNHLSHFRITEY